MQTNKSNTANTTKGRVVEGKVVSTKQNHTVIVEVVVTYRHPLYRKQIRRMRRFAAHNDIADLAVGDHIRMQEVKPMSKTKHFRVVERI